MTAVVVDVDNDGWPDVYVACDSTPSWLFRNQRDGTFREEGLERGVALSEDGMEQAGMGVGDRRLRSRRHLDLFKTHFADDTNVLYRNDGKGTSTTSRFEPASASRPATSAGEPGWWTSITTASPDLFLVTGSVYPEVERRSRLSGANTAPGVPKPRRRPLRGVDRRGRTRRAATHSSRGCAFGDFDNDGDVDVLVMNMNEPPSLLRNDVSGNGHWLKVLLNGVKSNRSAIGARVTARYGAHAGAGSDGAVELLLRQRSPPALRSRCRNHR